MKNILAFYAGYIVITYVVAIRYIHLIIFLICCIFLESCKTILVLVFNFYVKRDDVHELPLNAKENRNML